MNNLAIIYGDVEENYELAVKYFLMAIEKGCSAAMYNLASHYEDIDKNYELAIKYYLMAIENEDADAMHSLAMYYQKIEKNDVLALKYYLMAAHSQNYSSVKKINNKLKKHFDIDLAIKAYNFLTSENLAKLNKKICKTLLVEKIMNQNAAEINNVCTIFCCTNCKLEQVKCVFLECGHSICAQCYQQITKCPICSKGIFPLEHLGFDDVSTQKFIIKSKYL
ncbi:hypothetical protein QJ857_gp0357 [Tupanvirus soda lake]|uniref:RING-type domain-containing protein n=2 Tax=Tupanvirus TaxID=2094720 RepID=A0A6N1NMP4_9VIRU|nr:hypothetical protein QJ857_gp0357 [Tupanvirus soda lake]QKU35674.1 hypothetical protein [Tupanvirus soda lake]